MKLAIVEDSAILRLTMAELLQGRGHHVSIAASDATEFFAELKKLAETEGETALPDVVIMDVRMPPTFTSEGITAALTLRETHPTMGVLVFSQYVETRYATQLLANQPAGVGYLLKDRVAEVRQFVDALERIAAGETVLDPIVVSQLIGAAQRRDDVDALTARERAVLELMAQGRTNSAISADLHISLGTVEKHVSAIFSKLGLEHSDADHRRVLAVVRFLET